jgi:hypothetical protein
LAHSTQPLVPERVFLAGGQLEARSVSEGNGDGHSGSALATTGLVGLLLQTLLAERTTFANGDGQNDLAPLNELANRLTREALANMTPAEPAIAAAEPPRVLAN